MHSCLSMYACGLIFLNTIYNQVRLNNVNLQTDIVQRLDVKATGVFSIAAIMCNSFLLHHDLWKNKAYRIRISSINCEYLQFSPGQVDRVKIVSLQNEIVSIDGYL